MFIFRILDSQFPDHEVQASNPVFDQMIQRMRWPRRTRDLKIYVPGLVLGSLLLGLVTWRIMTRIAAQSGDELTGAVLYTTIGFSFLADLFYVLLSLLDIRRVLIENQRDWVERPGAEVFAALYAIALVRAWRVLGIELALRVTTITLSVVAIVTFLPPPSSTIGFPLIVALLWLAGLLIVEALWRMPTMTALGAFVAARVSGGEAGLLIAVIGVFAIRLLHMLVLGVVVYVIGSAINVITSAFFGGPLAAPTAQNFSLLVVPPCLWIATYLFYRGLRRAFFQRGIAAYQAIAPGILGRINIGRAVLATGLVGAAVLILLLVGFKKNPSGPAIAEITIFPDKPGRKIAADFLGLSFEAPVLNGPYFDPGDAVLVRLLENLGVGTLRFGGNAVEFTDWQAASGKESLTVLQESDLDRLFALVRETGWHVILGLNLGHYDPDRFAAEGQYAAKAGGTSLLALEIGNEPDLFMFNTRRPFWWGYQNFHGELAAYIQAVHRAAGGVPVAGPVTYGPTGIGWFRQAVADERTSLALATHHLYPLIRLPVILWGSPLAPTVDNLLSEDVIVRMADVVDQLMAASQGLPVQISETNSVANSGKIGVSDVFAASLWGTDYLFTLAEHGARGLNFHTVWNCATYTPICLRDGSISAQPLYYAMLVFHEATQGKAQVIPVEVRTSVNVKAHAVLGADGKLYVVLVNKTRSEDVKVRLIVNRNSAMVVRLLAPSVDSETGITFGGRGLNADGSWWPRPGEALNANGGVFELDLPAASVAVVEFD